MSYAKNTWQTGDVVTAEKLNRMEEGIEAASKAPVLENAKSTGGIGWTEQGDMTTITWDGDTAGRATVNFVYNVTHYRVADRFVSEDIMQGGAITFNGITTEIQEIDTIMENAAYVVGDGLMLVAKAGVYYDGAITVPYDGVYFGENDGRHITKLTYGTPDTVHKIDEKYLPNMIVHITYDEATDSYSFDRPYAEIKAAFPNVIALMKWSDSECVVFSPDSTFPGYGEYEEEHIAFWRSVGEYDYYADGEVEVERLCGISTTFYNLYPDGTVKRHEGNTQDPRQELFLCATDADQIMRITVTSDGTISAEPL